MLKESFWSVFQRGQVWHSQFDCNYDHNEWVMSFEQVNQLRKHIFFSTSFSLSYDDYNNDYKHNNDINYDHYDHFDHNDRTYNYDNK